MGNNSSGSAIRGSRDHLNETVDNEEKGNHGKRPVDDAKGSSTSSSSAAQPPDGNDDDATAYDMPYEQPSADANAPKGDVAASSSSGLRKVSAPAALSLADAAAIAASAAAVAKAANQRKASDADQSGCGSGEPASVEQRRQFFKKSKKKSGASSSTKSQDRSASQSESTVGGAAGTSDPAASLPVANPAGSGKVKPPAQADLARRGSKEESSSSTAPTSKSGVGASAAAAAISSRTKLPLAPLSPPPRLPVMRSTSTDGSTSSALNVAMPSSGSTAGRGEGAQVDSDDKDDGDDTYDRIQRDVRPSKVKAAAARQVVGSDRSGVYEEVHHVAPSQWQPPQIGPSATSATASGSQQIGRPQPLAPPALNEGNDEEGDGTYDVIQRDVNPAKAKQKRLQQQQQRPTGLSSLADRESDGYLAVENYSNFDDGADTYDSIQRDVNPLKAKQQQLQRAQSADSRMADSGDVRAKPRRAAISDANYTEYSLPQASTVEPSVRAGDGRGGLADPARTVAVAPGVRHQRSNNGSGEPFPTGPAAASVSEDDGGGEYECIRETFAVDIARPSAKGERPQWSEVGDSSEAGYMAIGEIGSSGSARLGASFATATSHGDDERTRVTAAPAVPPISAAATARTLYSEVRTVAQRPPAAAAAAAAAAPPAALPSGGSATAAASAGRLPPRPPPKQLSTSTDDDAYCAIAPSHAGSSSPALDGGRQSSDLQQTTAATASDAKGEQRKLRANVTSPHYENVDVSPLAPQQQQQQQGTTDASPTDIETNFESSSAFYANDQSLRGSPQPPALTASPPLPRSGARSRDAEAQRTRPAAAAQGSAGSPQPLQQQPLTPLSPGKPQLKAKPVGGLMYADIDLAVGTPAGHPAQQQQQHTGQHPHSTQDGLFKYGSTPTVGSPAPSVPLSPPRQRPWVRRYEPRYEDVDDVRGGAA